MNLFNAKPPQEKEPEFINFKLEQFLTKMDGTLDDMFVDAGERISENLRDILSGGKPSFGLKPYFNFNLTSDEVKKSFGFGIVQLSKLLAQLQKQKKDYKLRNTGIRIGNRFWGKVWTELEVKEVVREILIKHLESKFPVLYLPSFHSDDKFREVENNEAPEMSVMLKRTRNKPMILSAYDQNDNMIACLL